MAYIERTLRDCRPKSGHNACRLMKMLQHLKVLLSGDFTQRTAGLELPATFQQQHLHSAFSLWSSESFRFRFPGCATCENFFFSTFFFKVGKVPHFLPVQKALSTCFVMLILVGPKAQDSMHYLARVLHAVADAQRKKIWKFIRLHQVRCAI